ncbi:DUF2274 domain-containing protein [Bradyrhizobium sp.]|uniref:DUF2274 domain-containing protein n=1 Tax=Bradyrhizobium sp. TaxID=376 RepID=UPI0023947546|nr:DUF2274 domain-containing protein [Bradyrhizobium sp.]MDE1936499.1 DUF2274 domain-containing protein [Bradyrhizobium sp.]
MVKLKIEALSDEKPIKVSLDLPASLHRDLVAYADALGSYSGQPISDPVKLIVPMLARFMATDRAFSKAKTASRLAKRERPHG